VPTERIVVVGASMGGLRAAERIRAAGWTGAIVVIGAEPHMPYNRPPLSKEVLAGEAAFTSVEFRPRAGTELTWRLGTAVTAADLAGRTVTLADGEVLDFDGLVVATGLRPRRLPWPGPRAGRHVVRTVDDASALRAALTEPDLVPGRRLVVIGAGFIGCEVAATSRKLGAEVTVVDPLPLPMVGALGDLVAASLRRRHEARGVRFLLGRFVERFEGDTRVERVVLADGTALDADVVVEAVGSDVNVEWLAGNGLDLSDGVLCDAHLRVEGLPHVVAVGDAARFPNPRYDAVPRRVEHWSIPGDTAKRAAVTLVAGLTGRPLDDAPFAPLPSFWSDQHDYRIQAFGAPGLGTDDVRVLSGDPDGDLLVGYHRDDRLVGVVAVGGPAAMAQVMRHRAQLVDYSAAMPGSTSTPR
jgi:NADPH-dependent 2,4-dienoyl-CoA reductase/sulfur reductase-like enzyme